jgi:hypothetical protein
MPASADSCWVKFNGLTLLWRSDQSKHTLFANQLLEFNSTYLVKCRNRKDSIFGPRFLEIAVESLTLEISVRVPAAS